MYLFVLKKIPSFLLFTLLLPSLTWALPTQGSKILIVGQSPYANHWGEEVALMGGNVVDVAVAVGLAMTVTNPFNASLGGGGFALIDMGQGVEVLDFRETAPKAMHSDYYKNLPKDASISGGTAVGVPGFAAGLWELHKKHGHLPWRKLFKGPLQLASDGFRVSGGWVKKTEKNKERLNAAGKKYFFKKEQSSYQPGDVFSQVHLEKLLKKFRSSNINGFYKGAVAQDIVNAVKAQGGSLTLEDLEDYKVRWLKPLKTTFQNYEIYLMPPPSSGGVVLASALTLIEKSPVQNTLPLSVEEFHLLAEIQNRSFRGRTLLGDPAFHTNPLNFLTSEKYLQQMHKSISLKKAKQLSPLNEEKLPKDSNETTHFNVMDSNGHAISLTVTLNGNYGSGVVTEQYGITLNNEMDDFTTRPGEPNMFGLVQGQGNKVEAGKRPLSSMSPTLVKQNGKVVMALGAPGGPRIISGVLQTLYRTLVRKNNIDDAIQAPRVHQQYLPNKLFIDQERLSPEVIQGLKKKGHVVEESWMAQVNGIQLNENHILEGAYDARFEGSVEGY